MRLAIIVIITVSIFLIVGISIAQKDPQQIPDKSKEMLKEIIGKDGAKMVLIPAGEFQMGTDKSEIPELVKFAENQNLLNVKASSYEDETPRHTVYVDAFYMDAYEVTNAQYKKFVQTKVRNEPIGWISENNKFRSSFKPWEDKNYNGDDQPVVCVDWEDARAYADWAGKRLPTEAEWEYAARGGLAGKRYVWGDDWLPPKNSGNFADDIAKKVFPDWPAINGYNDDYAYTAPVGSFKPNGYGLYDMAGNVLEWCADWYDNKYYANSPKSNPAGSNSGERHILRGGSWYCYNPIVLSVSYRGKDYPIGRHGYGGFRCVVSATP
jgi:sulfatase modifying factor 1